MSSSRWPASHASFCPSSVNAAAFRELERAKRPRVRLGLANLVLSRVHGPWYPRHRGTPPLAALP